MQLQHLWSCDLTFHSVYHQRYEQKKLSFSVGNLQWILLSVLMYTRKPCILHFQILDPIFPGQELPLPLHLAEAGRMSWRPIGNSYLWSEYYNLSYLLSQDSKIGFLKSFVCYPLHTSGDPFRCCVSVRDIRLHSSSQLKKSGQILHNLDDSKKRFVYQLTLNTPLVVNNYLPEAVSLTIESSGVTRTAFLSEVCGLFFFM